MDYLVALSNYLLVEESSLATAVSHLQNSRSFLRGSGREGSEGCSILQTRAGMAAHVINRRRQYGKYIWT